MGDYPGVPVIYIVIQIMGDCPGVPGIFIFIQIMGDYPGVPGIFIFIIHSYITAIAARQELFCPSTTYPMIRLVYLFHFVNWPRLRRLIIQVNLFCSCCLLNIFPSMLWLVSSVVFKHYNGIRPLTFFDFTRIWRRWYPMVPNKLRIHHNFLAIEILVKLGRRSWLR